MTVPVPSSGSLRRGPRASAVIALAAIALGGCSMTLGSLSPSPEPKEEPAQITSSANIASLTETIKNNPDNPQAYNMRGSVLAQAGKTEEALTDFNKAISLDPNYGQAFANRGQIYRKTKRLDQAMPDYERALALDANYAPAWLGRGLVHKARGEATQALEDFNKAIALRPDDAEAYYNRGLLYQGEKQPPRPTAWCRNRSSPCSAAR
jgi:tetratricopeptide (TPR) repeat protein